MKLQNEELAHVNGAGTPAVVFTASVRFCAPVGNWLLNSAQRSCFNCRR